MIKPICHLFNLHDWQDIPEPTNSWYGTKSPGNICLKCGEVVFRGDISILTSPRETRETLAKIAYSKRFVSPGPYSNPRAPNKQPRTKYKG